ncbi:hypothetical protein KMW28_05050 [Flammeovirga yaeyamensis]|uniref:Lipoprotein n=1 Tax=Flammeovirga yaeyamensis TaxID=367791 RepID=A0AAX1N5U7_9BACT|nr:hypothetical protein [Flammeovirga yaeyamensis]MBB3697526.1 hypothetical protein [Flammeovirga yaeyamensis]NMF36220.1 hypothetical protein [Flammeovirga yaeyamensis]QWG02949.1 hypothetical protein KMW28_05050 [Flammeovirga yaeyamensis]
MIELIKKNKITLVVILLIGVVAMCNKKSHEASFKSKLEEPVVGHYYVFDDFPKLGSEYILKVDKIEEDRIIFLLPKYSYIIGSTSSDRYRKVRDEDQAGEFFSDEKIAVRKYEIIKMSKESSVGRKPALKDIF